MTEIYPFPTSAHSYFHALNKRSQKRRFLEGAIEQPTFRYRESLNPNVIGERIRIVHKSSDAVRRLRFIRASAYLQEDASTFEAFREANLANYEEPTEKLASAIMWRIAQNVTEDTQELWNEAIELIGSDTFKSGSVEPDQAVFEKYRTYLKKYTTLPSAGEDIQEALREQLESTGLSAQGWRLRVTEGADHARTHHTAKTIAIGRDYQPRRLSSVCRIVIHEVIGHAVRGHQGTLQESEGVAIFLEQLTTPTFAFRRSYRYLAVALGWGVFGKPRTFREVFEILWRLMVINSKYSEESAKQHAFDECYRAFRGGRPDIAGAVFLKDAVYFDASMRIWEILNSRQLSYNEFVDIIEGRRTILS